MNGVGDSAGSHASLLTADKIPIFSIIKYALFIKKSNRVRLKQFQTKCLTEVDIKTLTPVPMELIFTNTLDPVSGVHKCRIVLAMLTADKLALTVDKLGWLPVRISK